MEVEVEVEDEGLGDAVVSDEVAIHCYLDDDVLSYLVCILKDD